MSNELQQWGDGWISVSDRLPKSGGEYECRDDHQTFPAFFTETFRGKKFWLAPNENLIPTHWRPQTQLP